MIYSCRSGTESERQARLRFAETLHDEIKTKELVKNLFHIANPGKVTLKDIKTRLEWQNISMWRKYCDEIFILANEYLD